MPTYLLLTTLSPQGIQTLQVVPERLFEVNREIEALGIKVLGQWALLGPYDILNLVEAPNDEAIARLTADIASRGSAQVDVLKAMPVDTYLATVSDADAPSDG